MLTNIWNKVNGYKTYILAASGVLIALIGHFAGPSDLGPITIPYLSWTQVWDVVWNGGLFAALRNGVAKTEIK